MKKSIMEARLFARHAMMLSTLLAAAVSPAHAVAEEVSSQTSSPPSSAPSSPPSATPPPPPSTPQKPQTSSSSRYKDLVWKGIVVDLPSPERTLTGGDTAWRQELADHGIGVVSHLLVNGAYNTLPHARKSATGQQQYMGQQPTYLGSVFFGLTYDLSRYGIENGQIIAGVLPLKTNWESAGPSQGLSLSVLSYYQTFLNKKFELKLGYLPNTFEYYGPFVGGNIASSIFGSSGTIPTQIGLGHLNLPRPGANFKINFSEGAYSKFGIQRSSSPDGYVQGREDDETGFKWDIPNARQLYIGEAGIMRPATADGKQMWLRAGYIRNNSEFRDYRDGGRGTDDYASYVMADGQLLQFNSGAPAKGLYGGFSYQSANERYSAIDNTYELRLYGLGLFDSRPADLISFIVSRNTFSPDLMRAQKAAGDMVHSGTTTFTAAFNGEVQRGVRAGIGLSYSAIPTPVTYDDDTGHGLTLLSNLVVYF